jgi:hypothetical protein
MHKFRKKCVAGLLTLIVCSGFNDTNAQSKQGEGIKIIASPRGAIVRIGGEYGVTGSAPYTILQRLSGVYRIDAKRPGYEDYTAKFRFKPGANHRISIRMTKKTPGRAFFRSMFIPGWGQSYTDQKTKSWFIRTLALASAGYLIYSDVRYQSAVDDFESAVKSLEANRDGGLTATLQNAVLSAENSGDRRFERRRTALLVTGSVYIYNLLDALLFFPDFDIAGIKLSFDANTSNNAMNLGFSAGF